RRPGSSSGSSSKRSGRSTATLASSGSSSSARPDVRWHVAGTYLESCNCEAICPCRRIDGVTGGRSTYGICEGALSWQIVEGSAGDLDLSGLAVVLASRYSDDEEGSPWSYYLYLDERGSAGQREALEEIWTGGAVGDQLEHFPWAW